MALNKKKVIITIAAVAVIAGIGGIGQAMNTASEEEPSAPTTAASQPSSSTEAPQAEEPSPTTESASPEEAAPAEEAPVQVADDADPADIQTILDGFPEDGAGYIVLDSAAADHAEGTVVGLEVETPLGTTERGVWILLSNGSVQAANADTVAQTSASWPVRKDAPYALDDEVISVDMNLGN